MMAAEHAARAELLAEDINVKAIVLTVSFEVDGAILAVSSKIPRPAPPYLASSLHESAKDAGWSILDGLGR